MKKLANKIETYQVTDSIHVDEEKKIMRMYYHSGYIIRTMVLRNL